MSEPRKLSEKVKYPPNMEGIDYWRWCDDWQKELESLEAQLALYAKSGCDLVVCNLPQKCGTVQELEAQVTQLQEEKTSQGILIGDLQNQNFKLSQEIKEADEALDNSVDREAYEKLQHDSDKWQDQCTYLNHEKEVAESRLRAAQELVKKWRDYGSGYSTPWEKAFVHCSKELEKTLTCVSCTKADAEEEKT